MKYRKEILLLISKFEYRQALFRCKDLIQVSKKIFFNQPLRSFYPFLADSLLLAKCFIREDKFSQAEEVLSQSWVIFNKYVTNEDYKITNVVFEERGKEDLDDIQRYINSTANENIDELSKERERIKGNLTIIKELKRRTSLLATFASLFYNVGQLKKTEEVYVIYVQMIEQNYGLMSLETSNCYYLVGIFYLENAYMKKAMACMKRALEIRVNHVGQEHPCVADCYYSMGMIYYVIGDRSKATTWIMNALSIRLSNTGEDNIHVARVELDNGRFMRCWLRFL